MASCGQNSKSGGQVRNKIMRGWWHPWQHFLESDPISQTKFWENGGTLQTKFWESGGTFEQNLRECGTLQTKFWESSGTGTFEQNLREWWHPADKVFREWWHLWTKFWENGGTLQTRFLESGGTFEQNSERMVAPCRQSFERVGAPLNKILREWWHPAAKVLREWWHLGTKFLERGGTPRTKSEGVVAPPGQMLREYNAYAILVRKTVQIVYITTNLCLQDGSCLQFHLVVSCLSLVQFEQSCKSCLYFLSCLLSISCFDWTGWTRLLILPQFVCMFIDFVSSTKVVFSYV